MGPKEFFKFIRCDVITVMQGRQELLECIRCMVIIVTQGAEKFLNCTNGQVLGTGEVLQLYFDTREDSLRLSFSFFFNKLYVFCILFIICISL